MMQSRHFALGPILWRSVEGAEQANPQEQTAWQYGVARVAALVGNTRGVYGPVLAVALALAGAFAVPLPLYARVVVAAGIALFAYWLTPTLIAGLFALYAPYVQRNQARKVVTQLWMKLRNDLDAADRRREREVQAERAAFDSKWKETEQIRGLLGEAERRIQQLEAELRVARLEAAQMRVLDAASNEILREKIDAMVRRGFALGKELDVGPEPTATDDEGRGISFPIFPPESKWEPVYKSAHEANELLAEYDPGLPFAYADGVNAARRKFRRRERQRDAAQKKLSVSEQLQATVERLHRRPTEDLECYVSALVDVKKGLS